MVGTYDWLPMGSVVRANKGEHLVMVAGVMVTDGDTGRLYDYLGYPYPEGRVSEGGYFFNKSDVAEIYHVGLLNPMACQFQSYLEEGTPEFEDAKEEAKNESAEGTDK